MARLLALLLLAATVRADMVDDYFTRLEAHGFSGVVLIARGPDVVLRKAYGLADKTRNVAMQPDFAFNIASLDKQFIAAGILRLEEEGKLRTTDALAKFFDAPPDKASLTLHQVLSHTAGFPDEYWDSYPDLTRAQFIDRVFQQPLKTPGRFRYASFDYWLLEEVIERVSGIPFEQYLRKQFFDPLGMTMTGATLPKFDPNRVARYQLWTVDVSQFPGEAHYTNPLERPAAWRVLLSNADDLFRWYLAIRDGRVLTPESRAKWMTPVQNHYAYGWYVLKTARGTKLVHHGGGGSLIGHVATFRWFVDEDTLVVILNNSMMNGLNADYLMNDIEPMLFPAIARHAPSIASASYQLPHGGRIDVIPTNGRVIARSRDAEGIAALRFGGVGDGDVALQRTFTYEGSPEIHTYTRVHDDYVRVITSASEGVNIVDRVDLGPGIELVLAPSLNGDWTTYEPRVGTGVRIHFAADAMQITGAAGSLTARRIER